MTIVTLNMIRVDRALAAPLQQQLYHALRQAILERRLAPGGKLPSTRALMRELGVSRNTVLYTFEQLIAEGYLEGRQGSGTFVTTSLPDEHLRASNAAAAPVVRSSPPLSARAGALLAAPFSTVDEVEAPRALRPCIPSVDEFPLALWERLRSRVIKESGARLLRYDSALGYTPLREAIASYLADARGVRCGPDQVIIVAGSQQGLALSAHALADPGDVVWMEEPGYLATRRAFEVAGAKLTPIPVDADGITLPSDAPSPSVICVTPSHQFPLCATMNLSRRMALLDFARRSGAWIVEDDYDSEFRYTGRPLSSLQGLDIAGHVVYLGTFSKALYPALRLGYMVVPKPLVPVFEAARSLADGQSPLIDQAVAAVFLREGHFARHVRRMRTIYAQRLGALQEESAKHLRGILELDLVASGMHTVGWLPHGTDDRVAAARAAKAGVMVTPLSAYAMRPLARGGLVLGFAAYLPGQIRWAVRQLVRIAKGTQ